MDLKALNETELSDLLNEVLREQERRQRLANAPAQVAAIAIRYIEDGGAREDLVDALAP